MIVPSLTVIATLIILSILLMIAISWTGTVTKVVVRPNWRYL